MNYKKTVGENIRALRIAKGWTQEKLAVRCELSFEYVNRLENGHVNVSVGTLLKISKALRSAVIDLLKGLD